MVYVAICNNGRPAEVPRLILETDEERRRWAEAEARQKHRLERQSAKTNETKS
jgi:acyl-CoA hydrolase